MTKPNDDLEAVRALVQVLEPFDSKDRERIIRWACEKLGQTGAALSALLSAPLIDSTGSSATISAPAKDLKSFLNQKNPKTDLHLATAVAYYYRFEAPPSERKDFIDKQILIDACRKAERKRPPVPNQTLINAYNAGFLDKAGEKGKYHLNSVGENLVAMVLPESKEGTGVVRQRKTNASGKKRNRSKNRKTGKPGKSNKALRS